MWACVWGVAVVTEGSGHPLGQWRTNACRLLVALRGLWWWTCGEPSESSPLAAEGAGCRGWLLWGLPGAGDSRNNGQGGSGCAPNLSFPKRGVKPAGLKAAPRLTPDPSVFVDRSVPSRASWKLTSSLEGAGDVWGPLELVGLRLTSTVCLKRELGKHGPRGPNQGWEGQRAEDQHSLLCVWGTLRTARATHNRGVAATSWIGRGCSGRGSGVRI